MPELLLYNTHTHTVHGTDCVWLRGAAFQVGGGNKPLDLTPYRLVATWPVAGRRCPYCRPCARSGRCPRLQVAPDLTLRDVAGFAPSRFRQTCRRLNSRNIANVRAA